MHVKSPNHGGEYIFPMEDGNIAGRLSWHEKLPMDAEARSAWLLLNNPKHKQPNTSTSPTTPAHQPFVSVYI